MRTGENEQGLRKILDFTRLLSIAVLIIHFYLSCYVAFKELGLSSEITDRVIRIISNIKIFESVVLSKSVALALLLISLIGAKGRKDEKTDAKAWLIYGTLGIVLFFGSVLCFRIDLNLKALVSLYIAICSLGYILVLTSGTRLSRLIKFNLMGDIFNRDNETFPQEERKLDNPFSINLPARYYYKGKFRDSWINIINPFRGDRKSTRLNSSHVKISYAV